MTDEMNFALALVRVVVGLSMAAHGWNKAISLDGTAGWFDSIGMRPGRLHSRFAAAGELAAGLCFAVGLLTSFAALGFVGLMAVAWYTSHRSSGFFVIKGGWEYVMVLAVVEITVAMIGPGEWSIDHVVGIVDDFDGYVGLAISAAGGVVAATALLAVFFRPPPTPTN